MKRDIQETITSIVRRRASRQDTRGQLVDSILESTRGARPSDDYEDEKPQETGFAPAAASLETDDDIDLSFGSLEAVAREKGLKSLAGENQDVFDNLDPAKIRAGIEVEKEHTEDPAVAAVIAVHHILEFPDYYEALQKMEDELRSQQGDKGQPPPAEEPGDDSGLHGEMPTGGNDELDEPEEVDECKVPPQFRSKMDNKAAKEKREKKAKGKKDVDERFEIGQRARKAAGKSYSKTKEPNAYYGTATSIQKAINRKHGE